MTTVTELFEFTVEYEFSSTAHAIFWALSNNLVTPEDDTEKLTGLNFDKAAIEQLIKSNVLGLGKVKLYSIECKNNWYAFYFAKNVLELANLHRSLFGQEPGKIIEAQRLLHNYFTFDGDGTRFGTDMMLIEYRQKILDFPAYIGHAKAQTFVMTQFERVVKQVV